MPTTMKDIARDLGVAVITVSKAIHGHPDISERTRKRVLDRIKELNYTPNLAARSLVTGRTYLVGLVVPDLLHTFFAQIANSLSEALLKRGYGLIISTSGEDPELEKRTVERLLARRLDALVIASVCTDSAMFKSTAEAAPALILIDRHFPDVDTSYVGADDELIGVLATEHLIEIGCKRIAHLRGPETSPSIGRLNGYQKALAKHKFNSVPEYISAPRRADVRSRESGEEMMKQLLTLTPCPDGVFAYNDPMAIGAIHAILDAGLRVPDDVTVIGAGSLHYDSELRVPLSSIDQQTKQIGEKAARLTLTLLESKVRPRNKTVIIEPQLFVRASTARGRFGSTREER
jgi:LacI family transcriptional regulator